MVNPFFIGLPALIGGLLIGTLFRERSLRNLNTNQAGTLVLTLRPGRQRYWVISLCLLGAYIVLRFLLPQFEAPFFLTFISVWGYAMLVTQLRAWRGLKQHELPLDFFRFYGASMIFDSLGYLSICLAMAASQFVVIGE